jgi:hypothetical protein
MRRRARRRAAGILLLSLALAASAYWLLNSPRITSMEPVAFAPGSVLSIHGRNFGAVRGKVLLDSSQLTQSSYLSWTPEKIDVLLPPSLDSGILQVATSFGLSNPEIVISMANLPTKPENSMQAVSGPAIRAITPAEAVIGALVEIKGINFGSNIQFSGVRFSRNVAGKEGGGTIEGSSLSPEHKESSFVEPEDPMSMYESWDDKRISVRIPEGAGSGAVVVSTPQGDSEPFMFRVKQGSGSKNLFDPAVYSITFKVKVTKRQTNQAGTLVLYMPNPPSTFSQHLDDIQEEYPVPFMGDYGRVAVVKLSDFPGAEIDVKRTALVTVHSVETDLSGFKDTFEGGRVPNFLQSYVAEDNLVPAKSKEILALASKITGKEKNLQKRARLIATWLGKNMRWNASAGARESPQSALKAGAAGSRSYALLTCALFRAAGLPSVPVSGFLVGKDGQSHPHFWLEYYLPGVGWIPYDPVLALGAASMTFDGALDEPAHYFGSLDNRHLAISRGLVNIAPLMGGSELRTAEVPWSFQTLFEESLGAAYVSSWQEIEIIGVY